MRPGYPEELLDAAMELAGLSPGARLLEVGCGPGQATEQLARRGYTLLALERSEAMVGYARARLADRRSHTWARTFPRDEYLRLLCTYSDHILLPEPTRSELLERIGRLVDRSSAGRSSGRTGASSWWRAGSPADPPGLAPGRAGNTRAPHCGLSPPTTGSLL